MGRPGARFAVAIRQLRLDHSRYRPPLPARPASASVAGAPFARPGATMSRKPISRPPPSRGFRAFWLRDSSFAVLTYLALAVAIWWHVWSGGPSVSVAAGSLDPAQEVWFLAWALHTLERGGDLLFTPAAYAPAGVNLLANTSVLALGVLLAPVTALFGPVVSFNAAVTLAPAASAFTAYLALRRYVAWRPAAFVGGLCYGFGPFLAVDLRYGHLNLTFLAIPPLIWMALDDLIVRHRRRPVVDGVILGALVVVQFFVSTEMLAITLIVVLVGLSALALGHLGEVRKTALRAAPGLATGSIVAAGALAYPTWFAIWGPRHVTGPVFPNLANLSSTLAASVLPHGERAGIAFVSGGNGAYLGVPLVVLLVVGAAIWWRDGLVRFAVFMTMITYIASLGARLHVTKANTGLVLPLAVFAHLPLLDSIVASRFGAFVDLFAGFAVTLVLERLRGGDFGMLAEHRGQEKESHSHGLGRSVGCGLIALAIVVPLLALPPWPYPVTRLHEPAVFREPVLFALGSTGIVRVYPPLLIDDDPLVWQSEGDFSYALSDGYTIVPGTRGHSTEEPPLDSLAVVFAAGVLGTLRLPATASMDRALRRAVAAEHITALVVAPGGKGSARISAVFASAFGAPTARVDGGALWALGKVIKAAKSLPKG